MLLRPLRIRPLSTAEGTDRGRSALQHHHNLKQHTVDRGAGGNPRNALPATYMTPALRTSTADARMTREV
jgi:hypothetical protein